MSNFCLPRVCNTIIMGVWMWVCINVSVCVCVCVCVRNVYFVVLCECVIFLWKLVKQFLQTYMYSTKFKMLSMIILWHTNTFIKNTGPPPPPSALSPLPPYSPLLDFVNPTFLHFYTLNSIFPSSQLFKWFNNILTI